MKAMKNLQLSLLVMLIPVLFGCESKTDKVIDINAEKEAIQKVIDEHLEAMDRRDVSELLERKKEDFLVMPPNMPRIIGKDAYEEYCKIWIDSFETIKEKERSYTADEFVVSGDWAFQIGTYYTNFILEDDNVKEDEGNYVWIFKRDSEGNWKWARVISNSTKPLPLSE